MGYDPSWVIPLRAAARTAFEGRSGRRPQSRSRLRDQGPKARMTRSGAGACLRDLVFPPFVAFVEVLKIL
jgi:hypothetical protein